MAAGRYIHTLSNSDHDIEVSDDDDDGVGFKRRRIAPLCCTSPPLSATCYSAASQSPQCTFSVALLVGTSSRRAPRMSSGVVAKVDQEPEL